MLTKTGSSPSMAASGSAIHGSAHSWTAFPELLIQPWELASLISWIRVIQNCLCLFRSELVNSLADAVIRRADNLCCQQTSVGCPGFADSQGANGDAAGHLYDRQQ